MLAVGQCCGRRDSGWRWPTCLPARALARIDSAMAHLLKGSLDGAIDAL
ncbi:MAG: hypothetical protein ACRDSZ_05685 [Pseudonocardiaceae bacterium]